MLIRLLLLLRCGCSAGVLYTSSGVCVSAIDGGLAVGEDIYEADMLSLWLTYILLPYTKWNLELSFWYACRLG